MVEGTRPGLTLPEASQAGDRCNKALLRPKAWEPLVRHTEASALVLPLLVLGADDPERLPFGVRPPPKEQVEALHAIGAEIVPDCVVGIHGFWRERRARAASAGNGRGRPAGGAARRGRG